MCASKSPDPKDIQELIRSLQSPETDARKSLRKIQKEDWDACKAAAQTLKESGRKDDEKAVINFAQWLFEEAKREWSYKGTEEDVDIRQEEISAYDRVLEINPDHGACLNNQGVTYMQLKEWDKAAECFDRAIKAKPGYFPEMANTSSYYSELQTKGWANKAVSLWNGKEFEDALVAAEEAYKHDPSFKGTRDYMQANVPYRKFTL